MKGLKMKKIVYGILLSGFFCCFSLMDVNASSYINNMGVVIDSNVVSEFSDVISQDQFNNMPQSIYDHYVFKFQNGYERTSEIQVQRNLVQNGEILDTETYIMTEEEYEAFNNIEMYTVCDSGQACWETSAKRLFMEVSSSSSNADVALYAIWLREPNVKGTDVIAIRHDGRINVTSVEGIQYVDGAAENAIYYDLSSSNTQKFNNGVGISMNLKDDSSSFALHLYIFGGKNSSGNVYGSYQHGKNFTTVAESKQYTINSSGLGGVIKFNTTTISNKYDAMPGVSYSI